MIKNYVELKRKEKFERKIRIACDFHSTKFKYTQGTILNKFILFFIYVT